MDGAQNNFVLSPLIKLFLDVLEKQMYTNDKERTVRPFACDSLGEEQVIDIFLRVSSFVRLTLFNFFASVN